MQLSYIGQRQNCPIDRSHICCPLWNGVWICCPTLLSMVAAPSNESDWAGHATATVNDRDSPLRSPNQTNFKTCLGTRNF